MSENNSAKSSEKSSKKGKKSNKKTNQFLEVGAKDGASMYSAI